MAVWPHRNSELLSAAVDSFRLSNYAASALSSYASQIELYERHLRAQDQADGHSSIWFHFHLAFPLPEGFPNPFFFCWFILD